MKRLVLFANNDLGLRGTRIACASGAEVVALVVHAEGRARSRDEIVAASGVAPERIFTGDMLADAATRQAIGALRPDAGLSVSFGYILRRPLLDLFPMGVANLHTSLLPHGRGANPNVWAIVDRTPAGVTLHLMDEGVDTGPVLAGREVPKHAWDTGCDLFHRLQDAAATLLGEALPRWLAGELKPDHARNHGPAPVHRVRDLNALDELRLEDTVEVGRLIDVLRARTFPPYRGAWFRDPETGRRVYLRVELEPENTET